MKIFTFKLAENLAVKTVVKAADPSYRRRVATVIVVDKVELQGTAWSGGTRYTYTAVDLQTLKVMAAPQYDPPQFGGPTTAPVVTIPDNVAVVVTGFFCGEPKIATVYVNKCSLELPEGMVK